MRNTKVSTAGRKAREIKKEWLKKKKRKMKKWKRTRGNYTTDTKGTDI